MSPDRPPAARGPPAHPTPRPTRLHWGIELVGTSEIKDQQVTLYVVLGGGNDTNGCKHSEHFGSVGILGRGVGGMSYMN